MVRPPQHAHEPRGLLEQIAKTVAFGCKLFVQPVDSFLVRGKLLVGQLQRILGLPADLGKLQVRADLGDEFAGRKRLDEVVIGASI